MDAIVKLGALVRSLVADLDDAADARCAYREHGYDNREECGNLDCQESTRLIAEMNAALAICPVCGGYAIGHADEWSQTEGCPLMAAQVPAAVRAARPKVAAYERAMQDGDAQIRIAQSVRPPDLGGRGV